MNDALMTTTTLDPEAAWAAVLSRDSRSDGGFVYAVASTGVYCRPSCPSRRPDRRRVAFFSTPAAAEAAGYRACRRCRPASASSPGDERVERAVAFLDAHLDEPLTLARLGLEVGLSPAHLQRDFKRRIGLSPKEYVDARRAERLKERLKGGDTVTDATYEAGYGAPSRLYEQAPARLGMTPGTFRRGGRGATIHYTVAASPLGRLLVAATERGVCAVMLGDDDDALAADLRRDFPQAAIVRADAALAEPVSSTLRYLGGEMPALDLPLDLAATTFQWRVWKALTEIPPGETRSYGEIAAAIGAPGAARAVGRACGSNRVALAVPCHRAVPAAGGPGGYRWGPERKRRLLALEREAAAR